MCAENAIFSCFFGGSSSSNSGRDVRSLVESLLVKTCHFEDCCLLLELWSETVTCSFYICSE